MFGMYNELAVFLHKFISMQEWCARPTHTYDIIDCN